MNVTNKTTRTFDIFDITEDQAQDLLNIAACNEDQYSDSENETLNNLRKAFLAGGLTRKGEENAS